jgi:hypothetical protein
VEPSDIFFSDDSPGPSPEYLTQPTRSVCDDLNHCSRGVLDKTIGSRGVLEVKKLLRPASLGGLVLEEFGMCEAGLVQKAPVGPGWNVEPWEQSLAWGLGAYATIMVCMACTDLSIDFPACARSETGRIGNLERSCVHQVYDPIRFTYFSRPHGCMLCVCFVHFSHARARMCVRECVSGWVGARALELACSCAKLRTFPSVRYGSSKVSPMSH